MGSPRKFGLWSDAEFLKLTGAQGVSILGSQVTSLALPLTGVLLLSATPVEMGLLGAAQFAPFLLFGLIAGVWVDRVPRRPVLILSDVARGLIVVTVPILAALGSLRMEHLYAAAFFLGSFTVLFDIAYLSFVPSLLRREDLVEGNGKLETTRSVAQLAGPGVGGLLVQTLSAPVALLFDAASFFLSAFLLNLIPRKEPKLGRMTARRSLRHELAEGLFFVVRNPYVRSLAGCTATSNAFFFVTMAVYVLYATRELGVEPVALGLVFTGASVGGLLGALGAARLAHGIGTGPTVISSAGLIGFGVLMTPLASGSYVQVLLMLGMAQLLAGLGSTLYNVNQVSLRQALTPTELQGRVNASVRFVAWGAVPVGSLLGGLLGELLGLRMTLFVGGSGALLAVLWLLLSPLPRLRDPRLLFESAS